MLSGSLRVKWGDHLEQPWAKRIELAELRAGDFTPGQ